MALPAGARARRAEDWACTSGGLLGSPAPRQPGAHPSVSPPLRFAEFYGAWPERGRGGERQPEGPARWPNSETSGGPAARKGTVPCGRQLNNTHAEAHPVPSIHSRPAGVARGTGSLRRLATCAGAYHQKVAPQGMFIIIVTREMCLLARPMNAGGKCHPFRRGRSSPIRAKPSMWTA